MKIFSNLSLRVKFLFVILPLIAGLGFLAYLEARDSFKQTAILDRLYTAVDLSVNMSAVVHEIQKERGNSSGFISNRGEAFGPQLTDQRQLTNEKVFALQEMLSNSELSEIVSSNSSEFDEMLNLLNGIPDIRMGVNDLQYSANEAIDTYTIINTHILNLIGDIIPEANRSDIYGQVQAYINFLKSKERAGIERAIGTQGFSKGEMDAETYKRFSTLVAEQDAFLNAFRTTSNLEAIGYLNETVVGVEVDEVDRMRTILYSNFDLNDDPGYWFDMITVKINKLKKVEDYLSNQVQTFSAELSTNAKASSTTLLVLTGALALFVLVILVLVLGSILRNINKLSQFSNKLAKGKFGSKVEIGTNDELGKFGKTMNRMAYSIRKATHELNKERQKAEYMYKNTYRTSEVVFAHVDQGIFLIDSSLTISKLYAKAIESIFGESEIAGRKFTDFINKRLVPRDRQALEMFTKHLFNPKIKDTVLKRLNPIDSVQIFGDSDDVSDALNSKYIRIEFTRIREEGNIKDVMVTVIDETREVMLRKEIEANQEKNQQETEQLLNIMKVDPVALREFLDRASESIDDINERYENYKGNDYQEIATYTFNSVHNLKGNATLIDLDLLEDKFNDVEEGLVKLRGSRIDGSAFIKVLYELKDIQVTILELGRMLRKIANIYYKSANAEEIYSNDKLFGSFDKVIKRLSKSQNKQAGLVIENEHNLLVPERLKVAVNDIIVQLIRNSMAHGIESPEDRLSDGKDSEAKIKVHLEQSAEGKLLIKYADDGMGIDKEKIISKAKELGIYNDDDKASQNGTYAYQLLFQDGFSTKDRADNLGGRGQGMSLVKEILDKNNANFSVNSELGKGFAIVMEFPLESELYLNEV